MKKFEYMIIVYGRSENLSMMSKSMCVHGAMGWEAYAIMKSELGGFQVFFKREKNE